MSDVNNNLLSSDDQPMQWSSLRDQIGTINRPDPVNESPAQTDAKPTDKADGEKIFKQSEVSEIQKNFQKQINELNKQLAEITKNHESVTNERSLLLQEIDGLYANDEKKPDIEKIRKARVDHLTESARLSKEKIAFETERASFEKARQDYEKQKTVESYASKFGLPADELAQCRTPLDMLNYVLAKVNIPKSGTLPRPASPGSPGALPQKKTAEERVSAGLEKLKQKT